MEDLKTMYKEKLTKRNEIEFLEYTKKVLEDCDNENGLPKIFYEK